LKAMRDGQIKQAHVRFGVLDTNKDGRISPEEFNASGSKLFSTLDTNHDGVVDEKDSTEKF
jgi:Ca2+-binding EF-hand superfamily protein